MRYFFILFFYISIFGQQNSKVDFTKCNAIVKPNFSEKSISGNVSYSFKVNSVLDTIRIDAVKMTFDTVKINNKVVNFKNSGKQLLLFEGFKKGSNKLTFSYNATPKQALYFVGKNENFQIWTQGQGKYTSHWLPCFDDVNEKIVFGLEIVFDKEKNVISNGKLTKSSLNGNLKTWTFQMKQAMSSYLLMFAIGDFQSKTIKSKSGIPLDLYLEKEDFSKFDYTYIYTKEIFDFLEAQIGVKYPWQIYKQVPVRDFLYAGMENTSATIFSRDFVVDSIAYNDRNYVNINAHELAHQWFGDLVTANSSKHHWLQEGFATYYALLAEKHVFGEDYFYDKLYENALQLDEASKTDLIPILNEKASSLTFYQKGAIALFYLENQIGKKNFRKAVKSYLKKYKFKNVETDDFLNEIKKNSDFDTDKFKIDWLESSKFEINRINTLLIKNKSIEKLLEIKKLQKTVLKDKKEVFEAILKSDYYTNCKEEIIYQLENEKFEDKSKLLQLAMQINDLKVRQAVAKTLIEIPLEFKVDYESLLNDASYVTKKLSLTRLINNFPEDESIYLEKANRFSKSNLDFRILFLGLFISSKNTKEEIKSSCWKELKTYTSSSYENTIRQEALTIALALNSDDTQVLQNLVNGVLSPKWQFSKFCKEKIRLLLKTEKHQILFKSLLITLENNEQIVLKKLF